jgi:predicted dehydrogenase
VRAVRTAYHTHLMTTSSAPIRLGAIGAGLAMERLHWPALRQLTERFAVTAFAEKDRTATERFAA